MSYKIGDIAEVNGGKYKLVKGAECEKCCLNDKIECQMLPPCDGNGGHFIEVDAGDNVVLNIQHVSQLREQLRAYSDYLAREWNCPDVDNDVLDEYIDALNCG